MTMDAAKAGEGDVIMKDLGDPDYKGFDKVEVRTDSAQGNSSKVHYNRNPETGETGQFKVKQSSTDKTRGGADKKPEPVRRDESRYQFMKVICTNNNITDLPENKASRIKKYVFYSDGLIRNLVMEKEYLVYGLVFRDNCLWYQICHDPSDTYPSVYPSELFRVVDHSFSKHWHLDSSNNDRSEFFISYDSIVNEAGYLEKLIDGDEGAEEGFYAYRSKIEKEAGKGSGSVQVIPPFQWGREVELAG